MNKVHIKQNAWDMVKTTIGNKNIALVFMNKELKQNIPPEKLFKDQQNQNKKQDKKRNKNQVLKKRNPRNNTFLIVCKLNEKESNTNTQNRDSDLYTSAATHRFLEENPVHFYS